jgi:SAM-dependent methyltransferase
VKVLDHPLLEKQRNTFDLDNIRAYALRVRKHLSSGDHILDIGCGFGYVDLAIAELVEARFTLVDLTGNGHAKGYSAEGFAHNDLSITREVVSEIDATVIDARHDKWPSSADVVMSTLSWGWHYPLSVYLERVRAMKPRIIIADLREPAKISGYAEIDGFTINRKERTTVFRRDA